MDDDGVVDVSRVVAEFVTDAIKEAAQNKGVRQVAVSIQVLTKGGDDTVYTNDCANGGYLFTREIEGEIKIWVTIPDHNESLANQLLEAGTASLTAARSVAKRLWNARQAQLPHDRHH